MSEAFQWIQKLRHQAYANLLTEIISKSIPMVYVFHTLYHPYGLQTKVIEATRCGPKRTISQIRLRLLYVFPL